MMLLLIDANNLITRSFYGRPWLFDPKGRPIHGVSGFVDMVLRFNASYKPKMIIACWDSDGPTFRHQLYPDYKAHRKETPAELLEQIPRAKKVLEILNIAQAEINGYEADDLIGTLASTSSEFTRIVSGDKDMFQLISCNVMVDYLRTKKPPQHITFFDHEEMYGIDPGQWVDFKALVGDTSDNIPGVPGIGEKTVWPMLKQGLTLKDLMEHPDLLPIKAAKKLEKFKDQAILSRKLAQIECSVPIEMPGGSIVDVQSRLSKTTLQLLGLNHKIIA
jgi:DNA polymerase-1